MTIDEIKNLEGSIEQIAKLAKLVEEGKLDQKVYWQIRSEWSRKASLNKRTDKRKEQFIEAFGDSPEVIKQNEVEQFKKEVLLGVVMIEQKERVVDSKKSLLILKELPNGKAGVLL